jgi:casein kinase II subunit beta
MILDMECGGGEFSDDEDDTVEEEENEDDDDTDFFWKEKDKQPRRLKTSDPRIIEPYAFVLYGLIHQRYLTTRDGLRLMAERYTHAEFGTCPRYFCNEQPVLPMGKYDEPSKESVHLYCPNCHDIYHPSSIHHQRVDGNK